MNYHIKDINLAEKGKLRVEWAGHNMPVLQKIRERFLKDGLLKGIRISACLHVTSETANLMEALVGGGAEVSLCASNPLSTQDDVAAFLVKETGIKTFAIKGEDSQTYYDHIKETLSIMPHITMDDGADLVSTLHQERKDLTNGIIGGTEETTTGVIRLKNMAERGILLYPIIAVNDAYTKFLFDNRYGTGQSTIDGIIRGTNRLLAGSVFVVSGYGWCGKGLAMRARGMGANVIVTEVSPLRSLEAIMDGYRVMPIVEASKIGDIFCTLTGNRSVITKDHFLSMKDGAILANSGHFNLELDLESLEEITEKKRLVRDFLEEHTLINGKRINLLAEGRLVNLSVAEGHPSQVMDLSFANQALAVEFIVAKGKSLENKVYSLPADIDNRIARMKIESMGVQIDNLTEEQEAYLSGWELGT